ncbi:MAG: TetR family transcriptional regulator C-terminal domain-containing protein [Burkholderiales bacterium]|nr:TetR family transcriptional regulator C-terminal domain-containing protein [Burkholderiales bacterium]
MTRPPRAARLDKEQRILREAEAQFARYGFEGASLENIGVAAGMSRHALLYYFPSKEALYRRVLDEVLSHWLSGMGELARAADPAAGLRTYIAAKLKSSRRHPDGSRLFTKEVMAGAPHYGEAITKRVLPVLQADIDAFRRWARAGQVRRIDFRHLIFMIWAMTQAYADHASQFALLLGRPALGDAEFKAAQRVIEQLVWGALAPTPAPA